MSKAFWLAGAGLCSLISGAASAQSGTSVAGASEPRRNDNAIIVTARRQAENAQTVPVSITAVGPAELAERSVTSLEDLTRIAPGVRYTSEGGAGNTQVSIRGLTKLPIGAGTPAVVSYFADVALPADASNIPTFDLSSIQVLKGPQGTLFGRNTLGGAVLVVPQAPTFDTNGYFKIGYGNYNNVLAEGAINVPVIADKLAVRLAAQYRTRDGFQESIGTGPRFSGPDLDNLNQYSLRGTVLWEPSTSFSNSLLVDYFHGDEAPGNTAVFAGNPAIPGFVGGGLFSGFVPDLTARLAQAQADGPLKTRYSLTDGAYDREVWGITNTTSLEVSPNLSIKNIFGYRNTYLKYYTNVDGVGTLNGPPLMLPGLPPIVDSFVILRPGSITDAQQLSNEFQLLGKAFDDRLSYIGGLFYSRYYSGGPAGRFFDLFSPQDASGAVQLNPPISSTLSPENISKAVFAQIGYKITDKLTIDLGARYTWDTVRMCSSQLTRGGTSLDDAVFLTDAECKALAATSPNLGVGVASAKSSAPTWTIGLNYQVNDDLFLYAVTRRGYRQAGVNTPLFNTPCTSQTGPCPTASPPFVGNGVDLRPFQSTDEETLTDVEIGVKSNFDIGSARTQFNLTLFHSKYKNAVQFTNISPILSADTGFPSSGSVGFNAADLTIQGAEAEVGLRVGGLKISASGTYLNQEVDELFPLPQPLTPLLTEASVTLPSPKWSAAVTGSYTFSLGENSNIVFTADYFYTGGYQAQATPVPGYDLANFRVDLKGIGGRDIDFGFFVTNAFKQEYVLAAQVILPQFPVNTATFGPPRMFGAELTYRFGR